MRGRPLHPSPICPSPCPLYVMECGAGDGLGRPYIVPRWKTPWESMGRRVRASGQEPEQLPETKLASRKAGPRPDFSVTTEEAERRAWRHKQFT